jgi:hypothetical protein
MPDDGGLLHTEAVEKTCRVRGEEIEAVVNVRLRGLPDDARRAMAGLGRYRPSADRVMLASGRTLCRARVI